LGDREDDVLDVNGINKYDERAGDGEIPEGNRHHNRALLLAGEPLDDEAHEEQELPEEADNNPRIKEKGDEGGELPVVGSHVW